MVYQGAELSKDMYTMYDIRAQNSPNKNTSISGRRILKKKIRAFARS